MTVMGCVSFYSLDPALDAAIGRQTEALPWPSLDHLLSSTRREGVETRDYALTAAGHCRWQFDLAPTGEILAWRYPDKSAERYCRELPTSRP
ncbi:hypothetical protein RQP53_10870 [Paucibacter sp. APW11]|uniref:Uncharacterized protein n=1 Tax=Roseateles aquae TaxID=3077235 RepID=A0ABU3PB49_9BURK|nr:hypothetical protein [Paucibacter sp. APW11]MDT8999770.1 hypothetical protein [Paucibacter sp. APW11]